MARKANIASPAQMYGLIGGHSLALLDACLSSKNSKPPEPGVQRFVGWQPSERADV